MQRRAFLTTIAVSQLAGCARPSADTITGVTMGTTYAVTSPRLRERGAREAIEGEIRSVLASVVDTMSTFDEASELSWLNRARSTRWHPVCAGLFSVLETAARASEATDGAFDATIGPLVELWGFGPAMRNRIVPAPDRVEQQRATVGAGCLRLDPRARAVAKARPDVRIDLSSIAKGYGVDQVSAVLEAHGATHHLVEIGGEIRVRRAGSAQPAWRLALVSPEVGDPRTVGVLELSGGAVATSGNHRDFFVHDGRRYPHVLDPRTGAPVDHAPMSVTVVAGSAMWADALATGLLVMGPEVGPRFAEATGIAAFFAQVEGGALHRRVTRAMRPLLSS